MSMIRRARLMYGFPVPPGLDASDVEDHLIGAGLAVAEAGFDSRRWIVGVPLLVTETSVAFDFGELPLTRETLDLVETARRELNAEAPAQLQLIYEAF